ncbi:MHYT domain-containing protein [Ramlibacter tataouinensis]|nr:MHYT domain-containing protein [Ramlibacter tataouinensis]
MSTSYNASFVALSYAIAAIGAFVALTAATRIAGPGGRLNMINVLSAGLALGGIGVWSMHFIGMLALDVRMGIGYSLPETLVSLVAAVLATAAAMAWVGVKPSMGRLIGAGVLLGLAVCVMHYLGMYGMRFAGFFQWSSELVGLSIVIAIVAATAALWLGLVVRNIAARVAASLIMAAAVCAMHYTGMAAADFVCTSPNPMATPQGFGIISSLQLPVLVSVLALGMAFVISVDQAFQHFALGEQRRMAAMRRAAR